MATILIIDDSRDSREPLAKLLRLNGYRVVCADDGVDALIVLNQERPDLILLDLMMPRMDGLTFLGALRKEPAFTALPVIVLSALVDPQRGGRFAGLNVAAWLVKSRFGFAELLEAVRRVLRPESLSATPAIEGKDAGLVEREARG